jgi:hypothetical protein
VAFSVGVGADVVGKEVVLVVVLLDKLDVDVCVSRSGWV